MRPLLFKPLLFALLLSLAGAAAAQVRTIPVEAKRYTIRHVSDMIVELDGRLARLSAGAQVRDPANRIIVPNAIPAGVVVRVLPDAQGYVHRVWILTADEYRASLVLEPPKAVASPQTADK